MKGAWCYLYRAIDSTGATIDFPRSAFCDATAAKRLFRKALSDPSHPQPRVINTDQARLYGAAIAEVKATLGSPEPRSPKRTYSFRIASMKTLRFLLIDPAAGLARISGRKVLRLSSNPATETLDDRVADQLAA